MIASCLPKYPVVGIFRFKRYSINAKESNYIYLGGGVLGLNLLKTGKEMTETRLRTVKRF